MKRTLLALSLTVAACGGNGPAMPSSPGSDSFLTGTWSGTVTIRRQGLPTTTAATRWTIRPLANTSGTTYTTTAVINDAWLNVTATLTTTALPPEPGSVVHSDGTYTSPRGCTGTFWSEGKAESSTRITGSIDGVDCNQFPDTAVFRGTVELTKETR